MCIRDRYSIIQSELIYLRKINPYLEVFDETMRFNYSSKNIYNYNDIYLHNKLLFYLDESIYSSKFLVKWGKKNELFFDTFESASSTKGEVEDVQKLVSEFPDDVVLDSRFSILLNDAFLDKLKTYFTFWKQKHQVEVQIPSWYHSLYRTIETV